MHGELVTQLQKQLGFLQRSCDSYDAGFVDESIRIATVIRVLIHDTNHSTSLLKAMNKKNIKIVSSPGWIPDEINRAHLMSLASRNKNYHALAIPKRLGSSEFSLQPSLGQREHCVLVTIDDWWNQVVWMIADNCHMLTRREIILNASNKDGGAHVDLIIPAKYKSIKTKKEGMFYPFVFNYIVDAEEPNKSMQLTSVSHEESHLSAIRQMGYELLNSSELTEICNFQAKTNDKQIIWPNLYNGEFEK